MRLLIMGGTRFIGRHFVSTALSRGHEVTLFNRGRSAPNLFSGAGALQITGDRDKDLSGLSQGSWDAAVDFSALLPRQVHSLGTVLGNKLGLYVLVSSTAVYASPQQYGFGEDSPLLTLSEPLPQTVLADDSFGGFPADTYGVSKAMCEDEAKKMFPSSLVIRPTYVVGPGDYTQRFAYWVQRISRGGDILAPGPRDAFFQWIDVRDLTDWMLNSIEGGVTGTYNAAHPFPPATFGDVLETIAATVAPKGSRLIWVDRDFLLDKDLDPESLPLWPGANPDGILEAADPRRAWSVGLVPRPLQDTVTAIYDDVEYATSLGTPVGMSAALEQVLLSEWSEAQEDTR